VIARRGALMTRSTPQWRSLAVKSAMAMVPLVVSTYAAM
jgi:hypothetical protein